MALCLSRWPIVVAIAGVVVWLVQFCRAFVDGSLALSMALAFVIVVLLLA